jgi:hypothetical protein
MSFVSTLASALYAALPRQVRCPAPRRSEGERDFDALMEELRRADPSSAAARDVSPLTVTRCPWEGPTRAVMRRARH